MLGQNASSYKCDRTVTGVIFLVLKGMVILKCIKAVEFGSMNWIDPERTSQLPRKDCTPWSCQ